MNACALAARAAATTWAQIGVARDLLAHRARLLAGSYYGQTVQIWAALIASAVLSWGLIAIVALVERGVARRMGAH